jgi:tRNA modification GTPase
MTPERTTVTRLTSSAPAAIAVIEVRGERALELVQNHWSPHQGTSDLEIDRIRYGIFRSLPGDPASIGESIVAVRRGLDRFELHCHGGQAAALSILRALIDAGAVELNRREWIEREVPGRTAAEATEDLLQATTLRTASILMDQVRGALDSAWSRIDLHDQKAEWAEARDIANGLLRWADVGLHLVNPWRVVLCGPPNVGKSSLLNRLLGYSRAVVHAEAGTTRDLLAESTSIDGWPVTLIDSAGVRASEHEIESQGIERARRAIESADRLLLLVDPEQGWTDEHQSIWHSFANKCLLVQTKSDQETAIDKRKSLPAMAWSVSAVHGMGIEELMQAISHSLVPVPPSSGAAVPFRSRQVEMLSRLLASGKSDQGVRAE